MLKRVKSFFGNGDQESVTSISGSLKKVQRSSTPNNPKILETVSSPTPSRSIFTVRSPNQKIDRTSPNFPEINKSKSYAYRSVRRSSKSRQSPRNSRDPDKYPKTDTLNRPTIRNKEEANRRNPPRNPIIVIDEFKSKATPTPEPPQPSRDFKPEIRIKPLGSFAPDIDLLNSRESDKSLKKTAKPNRIDQQGPILSKSPKPPRHELEPPMTSDRIRKTRNSIDVRKEHMLDVYRSTNLTNTSDSTGSDIVCARKKVNFDSNQYISFNEDDFTVDLLTSRKFEKKLK